MVDLIVETGVGVPNANSLVSLEYADAYFEAHPFYSDTWSSLEPDKRKGLLIYATSSVSLMFTWPGTPSTLTQGQPWPRSGVLNGDGAYYGSTTIPDNLKRAICEYAYWLSTPQANPDAVSATAGVEEVKFDVITLKFGPSDAKRPVPVAVARLLAGLGVARFGGRVRRVSVGLA